MWDDYCKRKLKNDAVPTIFGYFFKKQVSVEDTKNDDNTNDNNKAINISEYINEEANVENKEVDIETVSLL